MESVIKRSFNLNLNILRVLGLYPSKSRLRVYLVYGYTLMFISLIPDPLFSVLYFLRVDGSKVMDAGFNLFLLVAMMCFIPKLVPFINNSEKIRKCIYFIDVSIKILPNDKQTKMIEECVRVCRRNSRFFLVCVVMDGITWSSRPLFSSDRELPMDIWLPFDPTKNVVVFYIIYVIIAIGVVYSGFISASIDPLIGGLAYHAAGQIMVLKDNLKFLNEHADAEISNMHFGDEVNKNLLKFEILYKKIQGCIQHHYAILTFVKEIENCFSTVVFSQFVGSIVIICFCCLQLSKLEIGSVSFMLMIVYLSSALIQIYFYCYYGTTLYEESNTLSTAAYLGQWYNYDLKSKKALVIFMQRANISMTVTAGKILDLSLDTFTTILRRSYSLLAVLKNY